MIRKSLFACRLVSTFLFMPMFALADQQPFSLSISAKETISKPGEPLHLQIILKNISSKEIRLAEPPGEPAPAEYQYTIDVRDSGGRSALHTEYGAKFKPGIVFRGSRVTRILQPGESIEDDAVLTKLFDLSRPGTYVVQASRSVPQYLGKGVVKSNTVTITLVK